MRAQSPAAKAASDPPPRPTPPPGATRCAHQLLGNPIGDAGCRPSSPKVEE